MIQGIDNYQTGIYGNINNVRNDQALRKINEQQTAQEEKKQEAVGQSTIDLRLSDIRPRANASLEDISLSLNEPGGFEMKGRQSDLESLDLQKAVSDMQKDQALMQYQYFVGDTNLSADEDGIVIQK